MDEQYEETDKVRVVVYPTLIIPAYQVKKKRRRKHPLNWYIGGLFTIITVVFILAIIVTLILMAIGMIISVEP